MKKLITMEQLVEVMSEGLPLNFDESWLPPIMRDATARLRAEGFHVPDYDRAIIFDMVYSRQAERSARSRNRRRHRDNPSRPTPRRREIRSLFQKYHGHTGGVVGQAAKSALHYAVIRRMLDAAEESGRAVFTWKHDENPDTSWLDQPGRDFRRDRELYDSGAMEILSCSLRLDGKVCASLGGISLLTATARQREDARRYADQVECELGMECEDDLRRITRMK